MLKGVKLPTEKPVYSVLAKRDIILQYMDYLQQRHLLNNKGEPLTEDAATTSAMTLEKHMKALKSLYEDQKVDGKLKQNEPDPRCKTFSDMKANIQAASAIQKKAVGRDWSTSQVLDFG